VLVNVAGIMDNFSSADGVTDDVWERVMAVNLTAPVKMMRGVLPLMRPGKDGCIVNVASTAAVSGAVAGVAYTSSKHGLVSCSRLTGCQSAAYPTYLPTLLSSIFRRHFVMIEATDSGGGRTGRSNQERGLAVQERGHQVQRRAPGGHRLQHRQQDCEWSQ